MRFLELDEIPSRLHEVKVILNVFSFIYGLRLPIHPTMHKLLHKVYLSHVQFFVNMWMGIYYYCLVLWLKHYYVEPFSFRK